MKMNPWHPMRDPIDIKHLGKLQEELGELQAAISRCMIQGINENEPVTGKSNRLWIEEEIADVYANLRLVINHFNLRPLSSRIILKMTQLKSWHDMA